MDNNMDKYVTRPKAEVIVQQGRYERYNLKENPFPSSPFVNPNSSDARSNGDIYEPSIRQEEYERMRKNFLEVPQSDPNHLRLGYIEDTSYVGRGNGKSAFLVNLQKRINQDFGLSVSDGHNKCFAVTLVPEPGGKTKTFESFVDLFVDSLLRSNIIDDSLTSIRLEAVLSLRQDFDVRKYFTGADDLRDKLNSEEWYKANKIDYRDVRTYILANPYMQRLPTDFPIYAGGSLFVQIPNQDEFAAYYRNLKRGKPRLEFVFSDLVGLFLAAGFNGAYVFVDDFERIPDFQSERQKRDFALELRTCLFDGLYTNSKLGFYNLILVLHAGVPRLMQQAWDASGLERRAPMSYKVVPKHVIRFEKITRDDTFSLIQKYLHEYRITPTEPASVEPFTKDAIEKMAELSELNASSILKMAYEVLERATDRGVLSIDGDFVSGSDQAIEAEERQAKGIHDTPTKDLRTESE